MNIVRWPSVICRLFLLTVCLVLPITPSHAQPAEIWPWDDLKSVPLEGICIVQSSTPQILKPKTASGIVIALNKNSFDGRSIHQNVRQYLGQPISLPIIRRIAESVNAHKKDKQLAITVTVPQQGFDKGFLYLNVYTTSIKDFGSNRNKIRVTIAPSMLPAPNTTPAKIKKIKLVADSIKLNKNSNRQLSQTLRENFSGQPANLEQLARMGIEISSIYHKAFGQSINISATPTNSRPGEITWNVKFSPQSDFDPRKSKLIVQTKPYFMTPSANTQIASTNDKVDREVAFVLGAQTIVPQTSSQTSTGIVQSQPYKNEVREIPGKTPKAKPAPAFRKSAPTVVQPEEEYPEEPQLVQNALPPSNEERRISTSDMDEADLSTPIPANDDRSVAQTSPSETEEELAQTTTDGEPLYPLDHLAGNSSGVATDMALSQEYEAQTKAEVQQAKSDIKAVTDEVRPSDKKDPIYNSEPAPAAPTSLSTPQEGTTAVDPVTGQTVFIPKYDDEVEAKPSTTPKVETPAQTVKDVDLRDLSNYNSFDNQLEVEQTTSSPAIVEQPVPVPPEPAKVEQAVPPIIEEPKKKEIEAPKIEEPKEDFVPLKVEEPVAKEEPSYTPETANSSLNEISNTISSSEQELKQKEEETPAPPVVTKKEVKVIKTETKSEEPVVTPMTDEIRTEKVKPVVKIVSNSDNLDDKEIEPIAKSKTESKKTTVTKKPSSSRHGAAVKGASKQQPAVEKKYPTPMKKSGDRDKEIE
jgi:hypothetical protein